MTNALASSALDVGKKWTMIAVRVCQPAWIPLRTRAFLLGPRGIIATAVPIIPAIVATASVFYADVAAVIPIDLVNGWNTLHDGERALKMLYAWGDDITHLCLRILVDAGGQSVEA